MKTHPITTATAGITEPNTVLGHAQRQYRIAQTVGEAAVASLLVDALVVLARVEREMAMLTPGQAMEPIQRAVTLNMLRSIVARGAAAPWISGSKTDEMEARRLASPIAQALAPFAPPQSRVHEDAERFSDETDEAFHALDGEEAA